DPLHDFFEKFFGGRPQKEFKQRSLGSGFIIDEDGYIVTNNHVIKGADNIQVTTSDNHTFSATVIGTDPSTDIALLKVEASGLDFIEFGNSDEARIGDWVLAVGNPFNLSSTVTAGIISAKARNINLLRANNLSNFPIESFIQTDAAVNPGNSGGALVNLNGQLIGINTAIASRSGSFSGYSFAVPSSIVQKVTNDLLEFGEVQRALIGVVIRQVNQEIAEDLNLDEVKGILVTGLSVNGAAINSGIIENDVIISINGVETDNVPELQELIGRYRPGDLVEVSLIREEEIIKIDVELRNRVGTTGVYRAKEFSASAMLQADLRVLNNRELHSLGLRNGVMITGFTGNKLRELGIEEGFIITHIDRNRVTKPEDITYYLEQSRGGVIIGGIYPNGQKASYGLGV
ncbi:MAG TPA: trypsin-like serine protease, partial [Bacteroidetes bacterium]|nr:trypsin-like serine protease [Bacteroidota bacterium]